MKSTSIRWTLAATVIAALVACGSSSEPVKTATTATTVSATASSVGGVNAQTFSFPSGVPALGLTGASTVKLSSAASTTTSPTFALTSGAAAASGNLGFGSCLFVVTASNIPGVIVGQTLTVNPCTYTAQTQGMLANGQATTVNVLLQLGITPSSANQASVSIDPANGVVTINGVSTGQSTTLVLVTGA